MGLVAGKFRLRQQGKGTGKVGIWKAIYMYIVYTCTCSALLYADINAVGFILNVTLNDIPRMGKDIEIIFNRC